MKSQQKVNLWFLSKNTYGGWCTFTAHLTRALESQGIGHSLYRLSKKGEKKHRVFGWDLKYRNLPEPVVSCVEHCRDLMAETGEGADLIVAVQKNFINQAASLLCNGAMIVIHDPTELRNKEFAELISKVQDQVIVIRKSMLKHIPGATFIPHPYEQQATGAMRLRKPKYNAITIGRIDFDKNFDWVLEANRRVSLVQKIHVHGFENRIYTRFNIVQNYPEWIQSKSHFPRELDWAVKKCAQARFMVDLSAIKGDGGGTQYTFLEAIDGGAICVLNSAWILPDGVMRPEVNCLEVSSTAQLVRALTKFPGGREDEIRHEALKLLAHHSPEIIGEEYKHVLFGR